MDKKQYIAPEAKVQELESDTLLGQSALDPGKNEQEIDPIDDPYDDEFGSNWNVWDIDNE